jgi:hypothetical protein
MEREIDCEYRRSFPMDLEVSKRGKSPQSGYAAGSRSIRAYLPKIDASFAMFPQEDFDALQLPYPSSIVMRPSFDPPNEQ